MNKLGVFEPMKRKEAGDNSASEAAEIILRIDDMISSRSKSRGGPDPSRNGGHGGRLE